MHGWIIVYPDKNQFIFRFRFRLFGAHLIINFIFIMSGLFPVLFSQEFEQILIDVWLK